MNEVLNIYDFNAETLKSYVRYHKAQDIISSFPFWVKDYAVELAKNGEQEYRYVFPIRTTKWAAGLVDYSDVEIEQLCPAFENELKKRGFSNVQVEFMISKETSERYIRVQFNW